MTGSEPRRRWVIRHRTAPRPGPHDGREPVVVVEVPLGGPVRIACPGGPVQLGPDEVQRLREALDLARAAVIWDRGRW